MNDQAEKRSVELFRSGFFCAESVLQAIAEHEGIRSDLIPRIATGFCSGTSRTGRMCGALSGAIMGIGLTAGRDRPTDSLESCYALTQELIRLFEAEFGSANCRELIGCDLATGAGQRHFMENNLIEDCYRYAETAARLAVSLLSEQDHPGI